MQVEIRMFFPSDFWRVAVWVAIACVATDYTRAESVPQFDLAECSQGVEVKLNGALFTRYVTVSGTKPILWPIVGPTGHMMTRQYPMEAAAPHEAPDHPHHRSLWFTHGDVNGISFWEGVNDGTFGVIKHRRFRQIRGGASGLIVAESDWVTARLEDPPQVSQGAPAVDPPIVVDENSILCHDVRRIGFSAGNSVRIIDFDVTLTAAGAPLRFGDTKEGSLGLRVSGPMSVDQRMGGQIVNREGATDSQAWGKRSAWVDYYGPAVPDGQVVGVAILHHPSSFRFPTFWHVRTYGLFAANPFGAKSFGHSTGTPEFPGPDGAYELQPGQSIRHRYRIVLHSGDAKGANIEHHFAEFALLP